MPKNTRRVTVTRQVTFQTTIDVPGYPDKTGPELIEILGGAAGNTGTLSLGELLAGSDLANAGTITRANWAAVGTPIRIEPYITRPRNAALTVGQRVVSITPVAGNEAALGKVFIVTEVNTGTNGGRTADSATEPTWTLSNGGETTDGGIKYRTADKFPTLSNYTQSTAYSVGTIFRPAAASLKEYMVVVQNASAASTPAFATSPNDTIGSTVAFQTGGSAICIAGVKTYAFQAQYALGDVVKSASGASDEFLVTVAGRSNTQTFHANGDGTGALPAAGDSVVRGTATFKRII